jgi:hypothetical protein
MFNFNFGKKRLDKKQIIIISAVLSAIIATLSQCTGVSQDRLWDLLDEIQRSLFPGTIINDVLLQDPNVVKRRVERDVDKALREVEGEYNMIIRKADKKYAPRYVEEKNDETLCYTPECKTLAPPMRICSVWDSTCPTTAPSVTEGLTEGSESGIIKESVGDKPPREPGKFRF